MRLWIFSDLHADRDPIELPTIAADAASSTTRATRTINTGYITLLCPRAGGGGRTHTRQGQPSRRRSDGASAEERCKKRKRDGSRGASVRSVLQL